jgi:hypothetical protein
MERFMNEKEPVARTPVEEAREALAQLINWLEDDTLEIMKDTRRMGITFDEADCQSLREQIEKAKIVLERKV